MKNLARFAAVTIIPGLLVGLVVVPALAQTPVVSVDAPDCVEGDFTVRLNITTISDFSAAQFDVSYDNTVLQLTNATDGDIGGNTLGVSWSWQPNPAAPDSGKIRVVVWGDVPGFNGAGYLTDIHFSVIGSPGDTSAITFSNSQISDSEPSEIPATWQDGSVEVCVPFEPVLISGTHEAPGALSTGDVAGAIPPGFTPGDEFAPGDTVWVWGEGFLPGQQYNLWVQAYAAGSVVAEGHTLSGGPIAPVPVTTDGSGTFGTPVALWTTSGGNAGTYWEVVADQVGTGQGTYNAADDGLDAIALEAYGFHVIPEALTIVLLAVGLVGLGGYYGLRRRRSSESDT